MEGSEKADKKIVRIDQLGQCSSMKNVQIIDGANNPTFSIFQATDDEFAMIFPNGQDMELSEDL